MQGTETEEAERGGNVKECGEEVGGKEGERESRGIK